MSIFHHRYILNDHKVPDIPEWTKELKLPTQSSIAENLKKLLIFTSLYSIYSWWLRKKSNFCVALHSSSLRRTISTSHSSEFARLEFGAFYFAIKTWFFTRPSQYGSLFQNRHSGLVLDSPWAEEQTACRTYPSTIFRSYGASGAVRSYWGG